MKRRHLASHHSLSWECEAITALNQLSGCCAEDAGTVLGDDSVLQEWARRHVADCVQSWGKPAADLTGRGAFRELQASHGYGGEPVTVAPFDSDLISLGSTDEPRDLAGLVAGGRDDVERFCSEYRLPRCIAEAELLKEGVPRRPYMDLSLRQPRNYEKLLAMMLENKMIEFASEVDETCGLFAVWKKNKRQRLIIDARRSNRWFKPPAHTDLATGDAFSRLVAVAEFAVEVGQTDIQDAFYQLALPEQLRSLFGLPRVRAGRVGVERLYDGRRVKPDEWIFPRLKVVAMGWTHALYWCQLVLEGATDRVKGLSAENRLLDCTAAPPLPGLVHTEYVDNFVAFSQGTGESQRAATLVKDELERAGLRCHPVVAGAGGETLGWSFASDEPLVSAKPSRIWRLRLALKHALKMPRLTGSQLEVLVGHCTHAFLMRRELLSCFGAVYSFILAGRDTARSLWPAVRKELEWAAALLCFCRRDLAAPFDETIHAVDASEWGLGAVETKVEEAISRELSRYSERWRFASETHAPCTDTEILCGSVGEKAQLVQGSPWPASKHLVPTVGSSVISRDWRVVGSHPWKRLESMPVLEARAALWSMRRKLRVLGNMGRRHVVLSDSFSAILALSKGRSSVPGMLRVSRAWAALLLITSSVVVLRWLPSEFNPSDAPSRRGLFPPGERQWRAGAVRGGQLEPPHRLVELGLEQRGGPSGARQSARAGALAACPGPGAQECSEDGEQHAAEAEPAGPCAGHARCDGGRGAAELPSACLGPATHEDTLQPGLGGADGVVPLDEHVILNGAGDGKEPLGLLRPPLLRGSASQQRLASADRRVVLQARVEPSAGPVLGENSSGLARLGETYTVDEQAPYTVGGDMPHLPFAGARRELAYGSGCADVRRVLLPPQRGLAVAGVSARAAALEHAPQPPTLDRDFASDGAGAAEQNESVGRLAYLGLGGSQVSGKSACRAGEEPEGDGAGLPVYLQRVGGKLSTSRHSVPVGVPGSTDLVRTETRGGLDRRGPRSPQSAGGSATRQLGGSSIGSQVPKGRQTHRAAATPRARRAKASSALCRDDWRHHERVIPFLRANRLVVRFAVELFSGSGRFSESWRRRAGCPIIEFDIRHGEQYDLCRKRVQQLVRGWLTCGWVVAVWLGTPCGSFSRARDRPGGPPRLRSDQCPLGLDDLKPADREKVRIGNIMMNFSASVLLLCRRHVIPAALENPAGSRIWLCKPIAAVRKWAVSREIVTDYCQFGEAWRKRTRILSVYADLSAAERKCHGKGICTATGRRHETLSGCHNGVFRTSLAEPYPRGLCRCLVDAFGDALAAQFTHGMCVSWE